MSYIYLSENQILMNQSDALIRNRMKLVKRYKELMEMAYNFRQTDSAISDISEFNAIKLLNKLNRLKYLER